LQAEIQELERGKCRLSGLAARAGEVSPETSEAGVIGAEPVARSATSD
jgi:hypothetical protein